MRLLADSNIVALAVRKLRADGHDILYAAERATDPGDAALLAEAAEQGRVFVTKDHDIGALVFGASAAHAGVLLIDDLASAKDETELLRHLIGKLETELAAGAFVRVDASGTRVASTKT